MKLKFEKVTRNIFKCTPSILSTTKDGFFSINPYIKENTNETELEKRYCVGIEIREKEKNDLGKLQPKYLARKTQKNFTFHTDILKLVVNLEAAIMEKISKSNDLERAVGIFELDYDNEKTYIRVSNVNNRIRDYLKSFDELDLEESIVFDAEIITKYKLIDTFKGELASAILLNEPEIEKVLKKYQDFLPLLIQGINGTAKFQYFIDVDGYRTNIADIGYSPENEFPNIIELKRADVRLFKKDEYRNNTCKLTSEFSNAIQQTNVQRSMIAASESDPYKVNAKSFLIIGNLQDEIAYHELESNDIELNLNIVKYNNKDCEIITYDKLLQRIDNLLVKLKSTKE